MSGRDGNQRNGLDRYPAAAGVAPDEAWPDQEEFDLLRTVRPLRIAAGADNQEGRWCFRVMQCRIADGFGESSMGFTINPPGGRERAGVMFSGIDRWWSITRRIAGPGPQRGGNVAERSESDWKELTAEGRRILQGVARRENLIDYGEFNRELAEATGLPAFDLSTDRGRADISQLLVRIHNLDWNEDNPYMITLLVKLSGGNHPGKGFFTLAADKGLYNPDVPEDAFWSQQVCLAHWAHKRVRL